MSNLKRLQQGASLQQIPGRTWNALVAGEERDRQKGPQINKGPEGGDAGDVPSPVRVGLYNDSGGDVPAGGVLKLSSPLNEPANDIATIFDNLAFVCDVPAANEQHVAICSEPIPDGAMGHGVIPGAAWAKVNVGDADHTYAKPKASTAELESDGSAGFPIIWKESGTGAGRWAVVSLSKPGGVNIIHGQAVGAVSGGTFDIDNIELKNGVDPRSDTSSTTETVEVENPFGWDIDDNGLVRAEQADDGTWIAVQAQCPA